MTPAAFWASVDKSAGSDGCWPYMGRLNGGYGRVSIDGRLVQAHRFVYESVIGVIPAGLSLDHLCRNRACCNPSHLEPVTTRENVLRGIAPTAINAAKRQCKNGHPYDHLRAGRRRCRNCDRAWMRDYRRRMAAGIGAPAVARRHDGCKNGHALTSIYLDNQGARVCRECHRAQDLASWHRRNAAQASS